MAYFFRTNITSGTLNVRASANASATVVFTLDKDEVVSASSNSQTSGFYYISRGTQSGYASASYMTQLSYSGSDGKINISSGSLNIRSCYATTYAAVGSLAKDTTVKVIQTASNGWKLVMNSAQSVCGWCDGTYISGGSGTGGGNTVVTYDMVVNGSIDPNTNKTAVLRSSTTGSNYTEAIRALQNYLIAIGWQTSTVLGISTSLSANGVFDTATDAAVRKFQTECAIGTDGVAGATTASRLKLAANDTNFTNYKPTVPTSFTFANYTGADTALLARIICGEHGFTGSTGHSDARAGVAKVLKNRYNNGSGKTGIVYGGGQSAGSVTWKGVVFGPVQYSTATGSDTSKMPACQPNRGTTAWTEALSLAQQIVAGTTPSGASNVTTHLYQMGYTVHTSSSPNMSGYCRYPTTGTYFSWFYY